MIGRVRRRARGAVAATAPPPIAEVEAPAAEPDLDPLEAYDRTRSTPHRSSICNAPWNNLYFSATGAVGPCWIQLGGFDQWSPERSIRDIWHGAPLEQLREGLARRAFPGGCQRCGDDIQRGVTPLAAVYDNDRPLGAWPTALELELSNLCNLECVMCNGDLSSKIRRNREHRPALDVPYDDSFVEQVAELIPTLQQVRFSGGEPLLHPILYQICDRIIELRPDLRIDISTNGSTLTPKVRRLLERARVQINISFESLSAATYEAIRPGADFAQLMANIEAFRELVAPNGGLVTINTNPMRETWAEMADMVRFCDARELHLTFNTVVQPARYSLATLDADELGGIVAVLESEVFEPAATPAQEWNRLQWANFVRQVRGWAQDAGFRSPTAEVPVQLSRP